MTPRIEYFFTSVSPWSYLGHDAFVSIAGKHGAEIVYKPVNLGKVFPETGGLPLAKRAPARQKYRIFELKRWREKRGLPINIQPAHFPTDPTLADCSVLAIAAAGKDPAGFLAGAYRAVWAEDREIADESVVTALLADAGHDAQAILDAAKSDEIGTVYEANAREAVERSVFGAPTYILNGEPFWGQDRIDLLADALASGRDPYTD
ncbi:2-hydroxychromene-2-carboxylate isomerase [Microbaculum marinum]|uniref:2-hydroxychromene-2-carboxylate isomerase n=1 Tax=Microbaculum marinum TaxID=1764581 RepID=A0AAW9RL21_9HYPH